MTFVTACKHLTKARLCDSLGGWHSGFLLRQSSAGNRPRARRLSLRSAIQKPWENDDDTEVIVLALGQLLILVLPRLRIEKHYTTTAGFSDHVFSTMHPLGFHFASRIRDLADTKSWVPKSERTLSELAPLISGRSEPRVHSCSPERDPALSNLDQIGHRRCLADDGQTRQSFASNGLAVALRKLGRIERTLCILDGLQAWNWRRRVSVELNEGESRNVLTRAVFLYHSGNSVTAALGNALSDEWPELGHGSAIVFRHTPSQERATSALQQYGPEADSDLRRYLPPLDRGTHQPYRRLRLTAESPAITGHIPTSSVPPKTRARFFRF